jgi:hypothetical protein
MSAGYPAPNRFSPPSNLTAWKWYMRYLNWMKKHSDPALEKSNYNADTWKERSLPKQAQ